MTSPATAFKIGEGVIEIISDASGLRTQVREQVKAAGAGQEVKIPVTADTRGFFRDVNGRLHDERGRFIAEGRAFGQAGGDAASRGFAGSFGKGLGVLSKLNFLPIPPVLLAIAAAAAPATAGILALGSSLGLAAAAGAAFLPAILGAVTGVGALILSFKGVAGALKEHAALAGLTGDAAVAANEKYQASLAKLSPEARRFTTTLVDMGDEFKAVSRAAEAGVLPGLTAGLQGLRAILPDIAGYVQAIGAEVGRAGANLGAMIGSDLFRGQLRDIMTQNEIAASNFASSLTPITQILTDITQAAAPLVARFSEAWLNGSLMIADWVQARRESGQLAQFFQLAGAELAVWWGILRNFTIGLVNLFAAATPQGREFSRTLLDISAAFRDWTSSEQARQGVQKLFEVIGGINPQQLLAVAAGLASLAVAFKALSGVQGVIGLVTGLASLGPVGLAIGAVAVAIGLLAAAFGYLYVTSAPVRRAVNDVVAAFRDDLGPVFGRVAAFLRDEVAPVLRDVMTGAFRTLADFLIDKVFPALREAYDIYLPKLQEAWRSVVQAFKDNETELRTFGGWLLKLAGFVVSEVIPNLGKMSGFLVGVFAGGIGVVIGVISFFVNAVHAIGAAFTWVRDTAVTVWGYITGFLSSAFQFIAGIVMGIYSTFVSVFQTIWNVVSSVFDTIVSIIRFALDIIVQLFNIAWTWVDQLTGGALSAVRDFIINAITTVRDFIAGALNMIVTGWQIAWDWVVSTATNAWNWITGAVGSGIDFVRNVVNDGLSFVGNLFSSIWGGIRNAWSAGWDWIFNTASGWIDRIRNVFTSMGDHISGVFHNLPRLIVGAINAVISGINGLIGHVNGILPGSPIPTLGTVNVPQGYAVGGRVIGPGTGTSDDVPIMASDGEFVLRAKAVKALEGAYGRGFLDFMNAYDVHGDPSLAVAKRRPGFADGGLITSTQAWIHAQDPKPYVLGSNGPDAWDCSSLVGGVWALLTGQDPYRRYFTTYTLPQAGGFVPGKGTYTIGLSREHVVGNLAGLKFEAANSNDGIIVGSGATDVDRMPAQYYLPQAGDKFIGGGFSLAQLFKNIIDEAVGGIRGKLPQPGGIINPIVTGLFDLSVEKLRKWSFDQGGYLPAGPAVTVNATGRRERVLNPDETEAYENGGTHYHFAPGAITLDVSKVKTVQDLLDLIDGIERTARQHGVRGGA